MLDADIICLQELWGFDFSAHLQMYHHCLSGVQGRGRGLGILFHRRLQLTKFEDSQPWTLLHDDRCWLAVACESKLVGQFLTFSIHIDPGLSSIGKIEQLEAMGIIQKKLGLSTIIAGDFNTHHGTLSKLLRCGEALSSMHIPYSPGLPTNFTHRHARTVTTEIDFILLSKNLKCKDRVALPSPSTHACIYIDVESPLNHSLSFKRYAQWVSLGLLKFLLFFLTVSAFSHLWASW